MGLELVDFKRSNWWVVVLIFIVIIIIFFPDFLTSFFKSDTTAPNPEKVEEVQKEAPAKKVEEKVIEDNTPVQAYNDNLPIGKRVLSKLKINKARRDTSVSEEQGLKKNEQVVAEASNAPLIPLENVTWANLRSEKVVEILKKARTDALTLATTFNNSYSDSKYALFNFVSGIDFILTGDERTMTAGDAAAYLEYLDMEVTRTFIRERVSRSYFTQWTNISITPALQSREAENFKKMARPQYNPAFELRSVEVTINNSFGRKDWNPYDEAHLVITGVAKPEDVDKVFLYYNGKLIENVGLSPAQDNEKVLEFRIDSTELRREYVFKIENVDGDSVVKRYRFDKIFDIPRWRLDSASQTLVFSVYPIQGAVRRADKMFRVSNSGQIAHSDDGFISSGDNDGFVTY